MTRLRIVGALILGDVCANSSRHQRGFSTLAWLLGIPVLLVALLIMAVIFFEGRKAYWDAQVKEMCAKDGGVQIIAKLHVSKEEIQALGAVDGMIGIPAKELAKPNAPVYETLNITDLRNGNPRVSRSEILVIRRMDETTVARATIYARSGGDFPSHAHRSSYSCPEFKSIISDFQNLFILEGNSR